MTFEKEMSLTRWDKFPSLEGYSFMAIWDKDNMWSAMKTDDVMKYCLDKQKVKEVLINWSGNMEYHAYKQIIKELGLEDD